MRCAQPSEAVCWLQAELCCAVSSPHCQYDGVTCCCREVPAIEYANHCCQLLPQEFCDAGNLGDYCIIHGSRQEGQLPTGHEMVSIVSTTVALFLVPRYCGRPP